MPIDLLLISSVPHHRDWFLSFCRRRKVTGHAAVTGMAGMEWLQSNKAVGVILSETISDLAPLQVTEWIRSQGEAGRILLLTERDTSGPLSASRLFDDKALIDLSDTVLTQKLEEKALSLLDPLSGKKEAETPGFCGIIGSSLKMQSVFETIKSVGPTSSTVLILGESGTGKELVAHSIHVTSKRKDKPFVVINCAAMPEALLESELFGHARGSFTGAIADKPGLFVTANGGTVFLDEVGEIPLALQVKLLRVLQGGDMTAVGSQDRIIVDVRIVAATNRKLSEMVAAGTFREDLYYRLNVIQLDLPSLKEKPEDLTLLTEHFIAKLSKRLKPIRKVAPDFMETLKNYPWPGNVRELENVIERAIVLSEDGVLSAKLLPSKLLSSAFYATQPAAEQELLPYAEAKKRALNIFNRSYILNLLEKTEGNISAASEIAGVDRSNFRKIMKKYQIDS